jgi:hypothetical protein
MDVRITMIEDKAKMRPSVCLYPPPSHWLIDAVHSTGRCNTI